MSDSRIAFLLFLGALLARTVAAQGAALFGTDGGHYLLMADWMREGRFHDALLLTYHPFYPLLIGLTRGVCASTEQAGQIVSVVLGAGAVFPLVALARTVFGRPAAFVTGLLYAFGPTLVEVQSDVMTESCYLFFFFSSMWLTWKMAEAPTLARGAVLGASAAAAFLTRPEGLLPIALALAWPLLFLLRSREAWGRRLAGVALTGATILLLLSPYLLWVKAQRGHFALSARASAISGERAVGIGDDAPEGSSQGVYYRQYGGALFRLSGYLIPFYLIGVWSLRSLDRLRMAFYFSFPLGQMAGIFVALRSHNFMTDRYLLAGMTLMSAVAALGLLRVAVWIVRRRPESSWSPAMAGLLLLIVGVAPGVRCLKLRRVETLSFPVAARWIRSREGPPPRGMSGPVEQVAYLSGCRSYYTPVRPDELREVLKSLPIDYFVYSEKDVVGRPDYVAMLRAFDGLEPPVAVDGPPGTWKVYVQRVKRAS